MTPGAPSAAYGLQEAAKRRQRLEERRLSDHAYAQRRAMLVLAAITFALTWGGVRLSSIDALGLQITAWNERYLLAFIAAVLGYLIGNFATLAEPSIADWRANFEWFKADATRVVDTSTQLVHTGAAMLKQALADAGASGAQAEQLSSLVQKIETTFDKDVPTRVERYIAAHRARLRFEYSVPVGISILVLYLVIVRLAALPPA